MTTQKKTSYSLLFYPSKTKLKKNGEAPVLMKININGERAVVNLKRSVPPEAWNTDKGRMAGRSQEAKILNDYLDAVVQRTRQKYNDLLITHDLVTPEMLRDAVLGIKTSSARMIVEVFEEHIQAMRQLIGKETTHATCQKMGACKAHFQKFLKKEYKAPDVPVKSVDRYMISKFSLYLKTESGCAYNTATKFLQNFKKITKICLQSNSRRLEAQEKARLAQNRAVEYPYFHTPFTPRTSWQRFCHTSYRQEYHGKKHGKPYLPRKLYQVRRREAGKAVVGLFG